MAVINDPTVAANIARVGNVAYIPQHVTAGPFPIGSGGAYRIDMQSANLTAGLVVGSEIFQFRYTTSNARVALIFGVSFSMANIVAASAAANCGVEVVAARSYTSNGSGGTAATLTGNNTKLRSSQATTEVADIRCASTVALTAGGRTLDTQGLGSVSFSFVTGAITVALDGNICPKTNLMGEFTGGLAWPLVLAGNEGFIIRTIGQNFPAGATPRFSVDIAWTETDAF
jgi:hypothetical protein